MPYLLSGNSVILKQDSIYYEHFYSDLQPWKHYVPFKKDLSDLLEKIQWVKDHDIEVSIHASPKCYPYLCLLMLYR